MVRLRISTHSDRSCSIAWLLTLAVTCLLLYGLLYCRALADGQTPPVEAPGLGDPLSKQAIADLPRHVFADGEGLPPGQGTSKQGAELYAQQCAGCHGSVGQGGKAVELVGDRSLLTSDYPDKGIAVYWPYAPTLFEYIYRSMPPDKPASLSAEQLYSVIAHLLVLNDLLVESSALDARSLADIKMPNESGFRTIGR